MSATSSEDEMDYPEHWGHLLSTKDNITENFSNYSNWSVQDIVNTFTYLEYKKKEYPLIGLLTNKSKVLRFQICCTRTKYLSEIY